MPPNADHSRLRQRLNPTKGTVNGSGSVNGAVNVQDILLSDTQSTTATTTNFRTIKDLKLLHGNEVAIDGIIYDLNSFVHPGGDVLNFFGGNDVTVQYKMIHPYHTGKHLEKMRVVGKVEGYKGEYKFDTPFEREIKSEVFKIVRRGREFGTPGFFFRAIIYITTFFSLQYLFSTMTPAWGYYRYLLAIAFGVSEASIGLNVQHDANHGAASKHPWVNDLLGFGADLIGGCKWSWLAQHWTHHAFTNHADKDPDSFSSEPVFNFNDYPLGHPKRRWWHRYQGVYFLMVLSLYWLSMVFNPQIVDLRHAGAAYVGIRMENDFIKKRRKYAMLLRLWYFFANFYMPIKNNGLNLTTFSLIMLMGMAESLTLAVLFSLSHNFEKSSRDPTKAHRETGEPVCWFASQVETSSTYGGRIAGMLTGGLNFQVEHHLFPRMSSAWYPYIAPTVRRVCEKHGVKYAYYPWIWQNFYSTVEYMHDAGTGANWELMPLSGRA